MSALRGQNVQGSFTWPYNDGYAHNQTQQYGTGRVTDQTGLDGKRASFRLRSATDNHEDGRVLDSRSHHPTTLNNSFGSKSGSQLLNYDADASQGTSLGIDPSLVDGSYYAKIREFNAAANETNAVESGTRDAGLSRNFDCNDYHAPIGNSPFLLSGADAVAGTASRAASRTALRSFRGTRAGACGRAGHHADRPSPSQSSGTTCDICKHDLNCEDPPTFTGTASSQKSSLKRHIRDEHSDGPKPFYVCLIDKDGSPCGKELGRRDNRRMHVEKIHPKKAKELPPSSRGANPITQALLGLWVPEVSNSAQ